MATRVQPLAFPAAPIQHLVLSLRRFLWAVFLPSLSPLWRPLSPLGRTVPPACTAGEEAQWTSNPATGSCRGRLSCEPENPSVSGRCETHAGLPSHPGHLAWLVPGCPWGKPIAGEARGGEARVPRTLGVSPARHPYVTLASRLLLTEVGGIIHGQHFRRKEDGEGAALEVM